MEDAQRVCKLGFLEGEGWCADTAVQLAAAWLSGFGSAAATVRRPGGGVAAADEVQSHAECLPRAYGAWWGEGRPQSMLCLWVWIRGDTKEQAWVEWLTHSVCPRIYTRTAAALMCNNLSLEFCVLKEHYTARWNGSVVLEPI